jgi:hypothetical protein
MLLVLNEKLTNFGSDHLFVLVTIYGNWWLLVVVMMMRMHHIARD